jgi:predicted esterase
MDVLSVTGKGPVEKVVVMLHGGGGGGTDWKTQYDAGWFGNTDGLKYVFPTSPNHLWYGSTKQSGCGLCDECAYTAGSIEESATRVNTLIEHEMAVVSNVTSRVYLGGFSQGGQLTAYMQIAKLNFALGGTIIMDGYALPPVCDAKTVASKATYSGADMKWFIYWGGADPIFPAKDSLDAYHGMFNALNASTALEFEHTEPGMGHTLTEKEFGEMVKFIRA